jgi:hypothetical protein
MRNFLKGYYDTISSEPVHVNAWAFGKVFFLLWKRGGSKDGGEGRERS